MSEQTDTVDWAGLRDGIVFWCSHMGDHAKATDLLRTRIEAAFVPVETVATVDAALARATARAEAAEARVKVLEAALRKIESMWRVGGELYGAVLTARQALGAEHGK